MTISYFKYMTIDFTCLNIYMYVSIHMYIHIYICVCIYIYMFMYIYLLGIVFQLDRSLLGRIVVCRRKEGAQSQARYVCSEFKV